MCLINFDDIQLIGRYQNNIRLYCILCKRILRQAAKTERLHLGGEA